MTKTTVLSIALLSIFLVSCKEKEENNTKISTLTEYKGTVIKQVNKKGETVLIAPMNVLKIDCDKETSETTFETTHKHCVENNTFILKSKAYTSNVSGTKSFNLDSLTTKIVKENTRYYLVENGMKVKEKFEGNDQFLIIEVLLTKTENSVTEVPLNNIDFIKKTLKAGDVLDFHLVDNDTGISFGDTKCPTNGIDKDDDRNYNYCATLISCQ